MKAASGTVAPLGERAWRKRLRTIDITTLSRMSNNKKMQKNTVLQNSILWTVVLA